MVAANSYLRSGDYARTEQMLDAVNAVLDVLSRGSSTPFSANPLAQDYFAMVQAIRSAGYQPQRILFGENTARVWAHTPGPGVVELNMIRSESGWMVGGEVGFLERFIYGQVKTRSKGGVQYRFKVSNATAATMRTHSMIARQPQPT
jgi:hypothetical protein